MLNPQYILMIFFVFAKNLLFESCNSIIFNLLVKFEIISMNLKQIKLIN